MKEGFSEVREGNSMGYEMDGRAPTATHILRQPGL